MKALPLNPVSSAFLLSGDKTCFIVMSYRSEILLRPHAVLALTLK
jgi:hypothetical protein